MRWLSLKWECLLQQLLPQTKSMMMKATLFMQTNSSNQFQFVLKRYGPLWVTVRIVKSVIVRNKLTNTVILRSCLFVRVCSSHRNPISKVVRRECAMTTPITKLLTLHQVKGIGVDLSM